MEQSSSARLNKWEWGAVVLILIVAASVRVYHLGYWSLWLDEIFSVATSSGHYPDMRPLEMNKVVVDAPNFTSLQDARPWHTIWPAMREGVHPPLYLLVLRPWREVVGDSDAAVRGLSVLASLIAIALLFDTGRQLLGTTAGLWAAALMAIAWPQVQYAQEARPYALLLALGMGAMNALARIAARGDSLRRLVALALCLWGLAMTHYFSVGALVASAMFAVIALRGKTRLRTILAHVAAGVLFLITWGPSLWHQRHIPSVTFLQERAEHPWLQTMWRFNDLPLRYFIDVNWLRELIYIPGIGAVVLVLLAIALRKRRELLLPVLWLICTAGTIALIDVARQTSHLTYIRYTLLAAPGLYLAIAAAGARSRISLGHLLPALVLALCALFLADYYDQPKENWRAVGQMLSEEARPSEPLIFAAQEEWNATALCLCVSRYFHGPSRPILAIDHPASAALANQLPPGRAWLIVAATPGQEFTQAQLEKWLPGSRIIASRQWSMVVVCQIERPIR